MQKISLQKRSFFNSIGLDVNNLPAELQIKANSIQKKIPLEDLKFLNQRDLTIPKEKHFRLNNLFGTDNIKLDNKTWIEIFSNNEKTDETISKYFENPNYYYKELKKLDQSGLNHNNTITLYEDDGKFFVKDGLARLSLVMIKYLLEMSRAQSKEEKIVINKQYIYAAMVRSTPKDRDIMYLINMILEIYGQKLKLQKIDNDNECSYIMKYENKQIEINSKKDFENFLRSSLLPKEYKNSESLLQKLSNISKVGLEYKKNDKVMEQFLVMGRLFSNYEMFVKYYQKMCQYNLEGKLIDKLDLRNVSYDDILKKLIKIVNQEEMSMSKLEVKNKNTKDEKNLIKKINRVNENTINVGAEKIKSVQKNSASKEQIIKKSRNVKSDTNDEINEQEELLKKLEEAKNLARDQLKCIIDNIEMTYYKLKTEESKIWDLANSTSVELNIDKINDNAINVNINSIKENIFTLKKEIEDEDSFDVINALNDTINDLKALSNDKDNINQYCEEMKSIFIVCFNKNVKKMITDSKLKKLDKQRKEIENEKCSFFSKLIGKAKLKQAKLDNISLKEQLILTESQFSSNSYTTLEDGLSDIYAYVRTEEDTSCLSELNIYLKDIETNAKINEMVDQKRLNKKVKEKIEQQRNLPQIALSREKKHFFSKAQINLVQEKNNELKRVIQINRANSLKLQNTGMIPILGNIKTTKAVRNFINNLTQIDNTLKNHIN